MTILGDPTMGTVTVSGGFYVKHKKMSLPFVDFRLFDSGCHGQLPDDPDLCEKMQNITVNLMGMPPIIYNYTCTTGLCSIGIK